MASHLHLSTLQSPSHITKTSPWIITQTKPTIIHSICNKPTYILQAQGRGFGVTTIPSNKKKSSNDDNNEGDDEEDAIPAVVFNRMLIRILSFVGVPMASGVALLYVLSSLKEKGIWESPGWLPFLTILLAFGTSALGIAYGSLSTSWDPDNEGSLLGWEQAQKNWPELWKEEEEIFNRYKVK
ncbi:uncharacterized protein A4U43_C04F25330 [Asparagus officinalis]|uniref:Uncharacterized protein n=1 Tax=Asparagus officinalis TaxID=4686 RepID=A0A5P1F3J1_ASPOF|nr:uncharacterized protein A4U43_C04F25330 [Asparagus officinalis]